MKIVGQSFIDPTEKFFHGLYVSAQGNPYLDGFDSFLGFIGPIGTVMIITVLVAVLLIGSYLLITKKLVPITETIPGIESP